MDGFDQGWTFLSWLAIVRLQGRGSGGEPSRQQRVGQHHQRVGGLDAGEWFIKGSRMSHAIDAAGSGGPAQVTGETADATGGVGDLDSAHGRGRTGCAAERTTGNLCSRLG